MLWFRKNLQIFFLGKDAPPFKLFGAPIRYENLAHALTALQ
jgi:hypothetical protein